MNPVIERFWSKVDKSGECWLWKASLRRDGYGQIAYQGRPIGAHRLAWILTHGPTELSVLHKCDTPACVRPDHLFLGTQADNLRDMVAKGRHGRYGANKTHCKHGHPFDEANTYRRKNGGRSCRACHVVAQHTYQQRNPCLPHP